MADNPNTSRRTDRGPSDGRYARGQGTTEEVDQTRRMPKSRIRHGALVVTIAVIVLIAILAIVVLY